MVAEDKIDMQALKSAVKEFNGLELTDAIKIIGVNKADLATAFGDAIDGLTEEQAAGLSENIVNTYNAIFSDEVGEEQKAAEKKAEKPAKKEKAEKPAKEKKEKAEKPAKEPKPKKEVAKGPFGSVVGSAANTIDTLVANGTTVEEIMAKAGVTRSRAVTHIKFLETQRGVVITKTKEGEVEKISGKLAEKK